MKERGKIWAIGLALLTIGSTIGILVWQSTELENNSNQRDTIFSLRFESDEELDEYFRGNASSGQSQADPYILEDLYFDAGEYENNEILNNKIKAIEEVSNFTLHLNK